MSTVHDPARLPAHDPVITWVQLLRVVTDGMQQVGPAQAETAVDDQRVACRAGGFDYGDTIPKGYPSSEGTLRLAG